MDVTVDQTRLSMRFYGTPPIHDTEKKWRMSVYFTVTFFLAEMTHSVI